jgi:hypothetical protein
VQMHQNRGDGRGRPVAFPIAYFVFAKRIAPRPRPGYGTGRRAAAHTGTTMSQNSGIGVEFNVDGLKEYTTIQVLNVAK